MAFIIIHVCVILETDIQAFFFFFFSPVEKKEYGKNYDKLECARANRWSIASENTVLGRRDTIYVIYTHNVLVIFQLFFSLYIHNRAIIIIAF